MLEKSLEWLSVSSADKWLLGKIKAFREQIHKCQNLKGLKRHYSATSSSFSLRNFTLDPACFWQKTEQHTASQIFPHIWYLPPNFHKQNHFPWCISGVHLFHTDLDQFPLHILRIHALSLSTGTVHSCPVTQKCMQRLRAKICCQNPILIIHQYPRHGQAELFRRNDGLTFAWTTNISVLWKTVCPAKAERARLQSCEHRQQSW